MKKICVITLLNVVNYGSVLQTYATQKIFEKLGYKVEFINYRRENETVDQIRKKQLKSIPNKQWIKKIYNIVIAIPRRNKQVNQTFGKFLRDNIHLTEKEYVGFNSLCEDVPKADIYCTGSDQMWNSKWNGGIEKSFFLDFVNQKPKIAFSTSIGMTEFNEAEANMIIPLLKKYDFITVREKSAQELLKSYGISAEMILDPTLLLPGEFWEKFAKKSKYTKEKKEYILVYKLHENHNDLDFDEYVRNTSKEFKLPVRVLSYGVPHKKDFDEYIGLPDIYDFVALFENARYVITDSFHGTSFCVNLKKQFSCIYPSHFSTRMDNILKICGLLDRHLKNQEEKSFLKQIDFEKSYQRLEQARKKSWEILDAQMKGIGDQRVNEDN